MWKQWIRSHLEALTVDPNFYPGYEDHAIQPPVIVHNAGDATVEHCVVKVTNMRNQEEFERPDVFSVSPGQDYPQRLVIPVPNLSKSQTLGKVKYRILLGSALPLALRASVNRLATFYT